MIKEMWDDFKDRWMIFKHVAKTNIWLALPFLFFPSVKDFERVQHLIDPEE